MPSFVSACCRLTYRAFGRRPAFTRLGRSGAVAIVSAICAPILVMIVGFAVDYGYASYINLRLAKATDDATVGSVSQTAATSAGGYSNTSFMQSYGVNLFNANIAQLPISGVKFNLSVVSDGSTGVIASGSYTYNAPTFFAGILGFNAIPVSGTARSSARPLTYMTYYFLIDNSQSMGIGATQADMTTLYNRVLFYKNASSADGGCVFGCHVKQAGQKYTNEDLAHNLTQNFGSKITLRIDSAVSAVQGIISSASSIAGTTQNIKIGLYAIGEDPTTGKSVIPVSDPPSTNYSQLTTAAGGIGLGNIYSNTTGNTDYKDEISDFLSGLVPALTQGSGASASSPLNFVFLITDGINDVPGSCSPKFPVCVTPFDANYCNSLKANATVGVIYTTYNPILKNNAGPALETRYAELVDGKTGQAQSNLQSCATSPEWFFEAQDGPAIVTSMQALFQKTLPISARISQ